MRAVLLALLAAGCASAPGRPFSTARLDREPGWLATRPVPLIEQEGEMDCGPAAAAMLLSFWDRAATPDELRRASGVPAGRGVTAGALRDLLRARGLEAFLVAGELADLETELAAGRPALVGTLRKGPGGLIAHYQVVTAIHRGRRSVVVADPAAGWREIPAAAFDQIWAEARRLLIVTFPPPESRVSSSARNRAASSGFDR
jgi:ABC-type bacteriocin/lantibiotic exporter with double-glycine peptidase domain